MSHKKQSVGIDVGNAPSVGVTTEWVECPACFGTKKIELRLETIPCKVCRNGMVLVTCRKWEGECPNS